VRGRAALFCCSAPAILFCAGPSRSLLLFCTGHSVLCGAEPLSFAVLHRPFPTLPDPELPLHGYYVIPYPYKNVLKYRTGVRDRLYPNKILGQAFILGEQGAILDLVLLCNIFCLRVQRELRHPARRRAAEHPHSTAWDRYLLAKVRLAQLERYFGVLFNSPLGTPVACLLTYCWIVSAQAQYKAGESPQTYLANFGLFAAHLVYPHPHTPIPTPPIPPSPPTSQTCTSP
jgi:hypothetical protein